MRHIKSGRIVLFKNISHGTLVHGGDAIIPLGTNSEWTFAECPEHWERVPNNEKIVLQND